MSADEASDNRKMSSPTKLLDVDQYASTFIRSLCEQSAQWDESHIETSLDSRDQEPFDGEWVTLNRAMEQEKSRFSAADLEHADEKFGAFARDTFIKIMKNTGSADLAGYIHDDVLLILLGLSMGVRDNFLFSLIHAYLNGKIPSNEMERIGHNLTGLY